MKLVIVESPAKAQTIRGYLGDDFLVEASIGHVRDLPTPSALPPSMKKGPYAKFAINVEAGFKPYYQVHPDRKKRVAELRKAVKEADELYLATDEDREGEAIAWHLLEVLKPTVPVKRMVFHEITKDAIQAALANTREIDNDLVDAQETRRVLDRLYGYEVSPVLWRKVAPSLSAGRVQSVATRLVVDREKERMAHVSAEYWSLTATVQPVNGVAEATSGFASSDANGDEESGAFTVRVANLGEKAVAGSNDFDSDGQLTAKAQKAGTLVLDEEASSTLTRALEGVRGTVSSVSQKPYRRRPAAPFTTSTLQQEASRKLKWSASTTMRVAQSLYEGGYITYMRTDSTALSTQALTAARNAVKQQFGVDAVPDKPRVYAKAAKGAQEAHEAIRPSGETFRSTDQVAGSLSAQQLALYNLIYKRTLATQMNDAVGYTATVRVDLPLASEVLGESIAVGTTSGTVITDPGFQRLYRESADGNGVTSAGSKAKQGMAGVSEANLPQVSEGDGVDVTGTEAEDHHTQPPGRFTEATLVKAMEELGIGRPSTYAATIQTIGDRGYIMHRGQYLIPTWLAFSVTRLLEENFSELVDYQFTAQMESDLDRIAAGEAKGAEWLHQFYYGELGPKGAKEIEEAAKAAQDAARAAAESGASDEQVAEVACSVLADAARASIATHGLRGTVANLGDIDAREVNSVAVAPGVVLRSGRFGPYLQTEDGRRTSVPPTIAPDEMTPELAEELLRVAAADGRELGVFPETGNVLVVKNGRYGPYVTEVLPEGETRKARTASLFSDMDVTTVTLQEALELLGLPREVGTDPAGGEVITAQNGPYGPYLKKGKETRQLPNERALLTVTLEEALEIYAQPKYGRGRGAVRTNLREFGNDPVTDKPVVVKDGRFGPYVTDGTTNATIPRTETVEGLTAERAYTLLADKRDKAPAPRRTGSTGRGRSSKAAPKSGASRTVKAGASRARKNASKSEK